MGAKKERDGHLPIRKSEKSEKSEKGKSEKVEWRKIRAIFTF